jgi:hypothetical protein
VPLVVTDVFDPQVGQLGTTTGAGDADGTDLKSLTSPSFGVLW